MSTPSSIETHAAEWESLVGKAILRFGDIELVSIKCLMLIATESVGRSAAKINFARRSELLIEILEANNELNEYLQELLSAFKQAKELIETRNLIAHNPVMLDIYVNEDETEYQVERSITSARSGEKSLDLQGLKEFVGQVENLSSVLWINFSKAANQTDEMWHKRDLAK